MMSEANDRFEEVATKFYNDTGMLRPGKDQMTPEPSREVREECFRVWLTMQAKVEALTKTQKKLVEWLQNDCPWEEDKILELIADEIADEIVEEIAEIINLYSYLQ